MSCTSNAASELESGIAASLSVLLLDEPVLSVRVLDTHRRDHRFARVRTGDQRELFVKAFHASAAAGFEAEASAYQQLAGRDLSPRLLRIDWSMRLLVMEARGSTRLRDLSARPLRAKLEAVPTLYADLLDLRSVRPSRDYRARLAHHVRSLAGVPQLHDLPSEKVIADLVDAMAEIPVHGDFQPSNILVDDETLVIDFESFGLGVPAVDVARVAYNPTIDLSAPERSALAAEMLDRVRAKTGVQTSALQFAAACCYWAITCAGYFSTVAADDPSAARSSDVALLSRRPLDLAAELWNEGH